LKVGLFNLRTNAETTRLIDEMKKIIVKQPMAFTHETYLVIFLSYDDDSGKITISAHDLDMKGIGHRCISEDSYKFPKALIFR